MPANFRIFPEFGTVYMDFFGTLRTEEALEMYKAYVAAPDFRPGQKYFVDLSRVEAVEYNHLLLMKFQAFLADYLLLPNQQILQVYYAPTQVAQDLAIIGSRVWQNCSGLVLRIIDEEEQALEFLGLPLRSVAALRSMA